MYNKIWINKCVQENCNAEYSESFIFNLSISGEKGKIVTSLAQKWFELTGVKDLSPLSEDLLIIALSVFAADKRIPRRSSDDAWTRKISLNIPVLELERWSSETQHLESMLSYLSGDIWKIDFRSCSLENRYMVKTRKNSSRKEILSSIECVSLFSGGLDSYCGAHDLLSQNKGTLFVSFKEYGKLDAIQTQLFRGFQEKYPDTSKLMFNFTAKAYAPIHGEFLPAENTSRSRSFLFLAAAICVADIVGNDTPIYIPENGFIGLNLPLTAGRRGSCSTRTTHPHFLKRFNSLLGNVGLAHKIINPYAFTTKREMVLPFLADDDFKRDAPLTISCSHPCNGRWAGRSQPTNCGYCYPCLIRQSSLIDIDLPNDIYSEQAISINYYMNKKGAKRSDLVDLINALYVSKRLTDKELLTKIKHTGNLSNDEALAFLRVYRETMRDLSVMVSKDSELARIAGIRE